MKEALRTSTRREAEMRKARGTAEKLEGAFDGVPNVVFKAPSTAPGLGVGW